MSVVAVIVVYTFSPNQCSDVLSHNREIEFSRGKTHDRVSARRQSYDSPNPNGRACLCQAGRLAPRRKQTIQTRFARRTPKPASAVLRRATTHGPKVRAIVPLALRCRNISQGLIGMESMPLRYQLHIYSPWARCVRWFRQWARSDRKNMAEYGTVVPTGMFVEDARRALSLIVHTLTLSHSAEATS